MGRGVDMSRPVCVGSTGWSYRDLEVIQGLMGLFGNCWDSDGSGQITPRPQGGWPNGRTGGGPGGLATEPVHVPGSPPEVEELCPDRSPAEGCCEKSSRP